MVQKLILMHHKLCDYTCMWNGMEDLYERRTGEEVPDYFFFCLSGIGNFIYLKLGEGKVRRMASWNNGHTKKMYKAICDTVGFKYKFIEGRSFSYALLKAKEQIDQNSPVILGCLDMYYLQYYEKFYHKAHIPIHYILMVGYNEEEQCIYVHDCGLPDIQKVSFFELEKALDIKKTELSDKNSICCVDFSGNIKSIRQIAIEGFQAKAEAVLRPNTGFLGIPGIRKLAKEIGIWPKELTSEEYKVSLMNMVEFTGEVPLLPVKLRDDTETKDIRHCAVRDRLGQLLIELGKKYMFPKWLQAGELFLKSGDILQEMTDVIVEYLLGNRENLKELPDFINQIADIEEEAYKLIDIN